MSDFALLDLFREEVEAHTGVLTSGLIALETGPADSGRIEPLMRAAHSLKGAARVLGLDAAVGIAHAMEDALLAAKEGRLALTPARVDVLLEGVDWIVVLAQVDEPDLPAWLATQADAAENLERRLRHLDQVAATAGGISVTAAATPVPAPTAGSKGGGAEAALSDAETEAAAVPAPGPESAAAGAPDRAVKISAEVLNRIISLASESLVDTHRMEDTLDGLEATRRGLDRLAAVLAKEGPSGSALRLLEEIRGRLGRTLEALDAHLRRAASTAESQFREVVAGRMRPFEEGARSFPRQVRDLARELGKQVHFEIGGGATLVDRDILAKLEAPLGHLLRNALDHGLEQPEERRAAGKPERGSLRLEARHHAGLLLITVSDDGRGVDRERLRRKIVERNLTTAALAMQMTDTELFDFLFLPGLSTRDVTSRVSGRGVGLDVVQSMVHAEGGSVSVESRSGRGTVFRLQLPVTRSVVRALLVRLGGEPYAFPLARIGRLVALDPAELKAIEGRSYFIADGANIALVAARELLGMDPPDAVADRVPAVVLTNQGESYAIEVDGFLGESELVVRPMDARFGKVPHVSAVSVAEDGMPVLILDVDDLFRSIASMLSGGLAVGRRNRAAPERRRVRRILVVDDSITVRELERRLLENHGYEVDVAVDGMEGWNALALGRYDLVVSDIDMPRMNGIELVRRIRADARFERLPVMIVSYKDREEDRMAGLEAGADHYLAKSGFRDDTLIRAVQELIGEATV
ncbi:chemotaxis protein [Methylococcus capsulatus str. Bath]|uniref:Chemotaxis protein CheA n=1 Tax=Methylococcus capsulatus (strain ATCC 33009 / NCIMB 11132 / Bath) TaxID=243233 RepID=Q60AL8_METCA|nr:hybrid sensor histidine kinase/response regulator [Methylococcus capsulatus]AAU93087.1 chemotaxis protein [Methylococcus capsulatus str. Bath]